jgi:hypothetical protein
LLVIGSGSCVIELRSRTQGAEISVAMHDFGTGYCEERKRRSNPAASFVKFS